MIVFIGGADQREVLLVGNGKADAPVGVLEDVAAVVVVELVDDDVAALDQADAVGRVHADDRAEHLAHPGPAGVDQKLRAATVVLRAACASSSVQRHRPSSRRALTQRVRVLMSAPRSAASRALSTTRRASSTQQSEYSKARVNSGLSGLPVSIAREIEAARRRQDLAATEMIVEKEAEPQDRPGPAGPRDAAARSAAAR